MPGGKLRELRQRVQAIRDIQKTTQAMKLVSAAKLRRAQDALFRMRPFAHALEEILQALLRQGEEDQPALREWERAPEHTRRTGLVVLVTANRGLCGAFNTNLIRRAWRFIQEKYGGDRSLPVEVLAIGKKGAQAIEKMGLPVDKQFLGILEHLRFQDAYRVATHLIEGFRSGRWFRIDVVYAHFKNATTQLPVVASFLPLRSVDMSMMPDVVRRGRGSGERVRGGAEAEEAAGYRSLYIFEPAAPELLGRLIPWLLQMRLYAFLLEARASEHAARMTAMEKASENAKNLIQELTLVMNKVRQETITREIVELVTGAQALGT